MQAGSRLGRVRSDLLPPRPALQAGVTLLVPLVAATVAAALVGGAMAALGCALAAAVGAQVAIARVGAPVRLVFAAAVLVAGVGGLLCETRPRAAAGLVALAGLAQAPFHRRAAGVAVMLPVVAAVTSSTPLPREPVALGAGLLLGLATTVLVVRACRLGADPEPLPVALAWRHAGVLAAAAALATYVSLRLDVDHGYWLVLTLAAVLRPLPHHTRTAARDRVAGTLAGIALAIAVVLLAPTWVALTAAAAAAVLMIAWALARDVRRQALFGTPVVILLGSSGVAGASVGLAASRLLLTTAGAVVAVGLARLLLVADEAREPTPPIDGKASS